jgi:hypothetical protein
VLKEEAEDQKKVDKIVYHMNIGKKYIFSPIIQGPIIKQHSILNNKITTPISI